MTTLHSCAQEFLKTWPFMEALLSIGEVHFTGSYALDTMTWPDIDLELEPVSKERKAPEVLGSLAAILFMDRRVSKVDFRNFTHHSRPGMTRGFCLSIQVLDEDLRLFDQGLFWKVDLWILENSAPSRLFMEKLLTQMTTHEKELILNYKRTWTKMYGRPPQMASYFLYQAVVFEGLKEEQEILASLRERGVKV